MMIFGGMPATTDQPSPRAPRSLLARVPASAAGLQERVPDAVLVGGSAAGLADIDRCYADQHEGPDGVASQLARQLSDPRPADSQVTGELAHYRGLQERWHDWLETVGICQKLADYILEIE